MWLRCLGWSSLYPVPGTDFRTAVFIVAVVLVLGIKLKGMLPLSLPHCSRVHQGSGGF